VTPDDFADRDPWQCLGDRHSLFLHNLSAATIGDPSFVAPLAASIALAVLVMHAARCIHPPASATALLVVVTPSMQHPVFLFFPVPLGAFVVVTIAWLVHFVEARFPSRWGRYEMHQRRTGG